MDNVLSIGFNIELMAKKYNGYEENSSDKFNMYDFFPSTRAVNDKGSLEKRDFKKVCEERASSKLWEMNSYGCDSVSH